MAKTVNMGDKYEHRLTLRLTDRQFNFVVACAELLGVSPSEYIRMSINAYLVASEKELRDNASKIHEDRNGKSINAYLHDLYEQKKGMVGTNENVKTDFNN